MYLVSEWQDFNSQYCSAIVWEPGVLAVVGTCMLSALSSVDVTLSGNFQSNFGKQSLTGTSPKVKCAFIYPLFVYTSKVFVNVGFLFMKFEGQACLSSMWLSLSVLACPTPSFTLISPHYLQAENIAVIREPFLNTFNEPMKRESCQLYSGCLLSSAMTCLFRSCYWLGTDQELSQHPA